MMLNEDKVTEIFFMADEFCKFFDCLMQKYTLAASSKRIYHRDGMLLKVEVTILTTIVWNTSLS